MLLKVNLTAKIIDIKSWAKYLFLSSLAPLPQILWVLLKLLKEVLISISCTNINHRLYIVKTEQDQWHPFHSCAEALYTEQMAGNIIHSFLLAKHLLLHHPHLVEVRELLVTHQSLFSGELPSTKQANHLLPVCYFSSIDLSGLSSSVSLSLSEAETRRLWDMKTEKRLSIKGVRRQTNLSWNVLLCDLELLFHHWRHLTASHSL